ncbi:cytochrome P450 [Xylaria bambusicola]|uniref:cytochrome P450 n=1 Tax=Xylaria bambusicola TaxID=326684 RepID=UPI0020077943|nr:cytochrome P450 [Xylaria bambusicola]KAI0525454.1 cytochrome P450 [Xylaria bambusicola]
MNIVVDFAQKGLVLWLVYAIGRMVYNVFFHPLRKFPGPLSHRLSVIPRTIYMVNGRLPFHMDKLHKKYGPIVRIGPNELAFSSPQAWRDIYGHKKAGETEFPKFEGTYHLFPHLPRSLINATRGEHGALRRQLSHGFSDRSMREQEPIIGSYVDLLMQRLKEVTKENKVQNLREWYNYATFDIIGDLSLGSEGGFGCLQQSEYHPWVSLITQVVRQGGIIQGLYHLGVAWPIVWASKLGLLADSKHRSIVWEKVGQRMKGGERPDFLEGLIRKKDELKLDQAGMSMNASLLILAGSETTATLLSGATYLLTTNPNVLKKLEQEVRSTFKSDDEITLLSVSNLPYMLACLNESLRRYPPVAGGLPRRAPKGGAVIGGKFIPQDTIVSIFQWAVNHDEHYWTAPQEFSPERWMEDPKFKDDQLDAMQSFSVGPRNCIGRNLAYAEMRLILAKIIYNFDMSLADDSRHWLRGQRAYTIWDKPPLNVVLTPVVR